MGEQNDGFIAVIDLAVGEAGLIREDELDVILAGNVGSRDHRELVPVDVAAVFDFANQAAGNGAAHGRSVPHAVALDVVDIPRAAQQLIDPFLSGDGGADDAGFRMRAHGGKPRSERTG